MSKRITIDPITRIEGHLRIDVEVDQGKVQKAWASSTMFRGIERILLGRDPREAWLFTQRFCGVCTTVHALASVRAVEDALDLEIPLNAQYIRNLILIAHALHDHVVHFYQLSALDWVDVTQVLKADPKKASSIAESLSDWTDNSEKQMAAVKQRVAGLVGSGQLGPFAHGYWGHPAMKLPPEINLIAVSHYLQALEYQRYSNQVVAMLGGKTPHIQNVAVGGVANAINLGSEAALNVDRLFQMKSLLEKIVSFVQNVYVPDVCAIAGFYPDWFSYGAGVTNYLSVPDLPLDGKSTQFELPGGFIPNGDLAKLVPITGQKDETWRRAVTEDSAHAWYKGGGPLHPWKGETDPEPTEWDEEKKYSWVKAPRYNGQPAQVGPLANVLVGYAQGNPLMKKWTDAALDKISAIAHVRATPAMLHSTLGRHGARAIRAAALSDLALKQWQLLTDNILKGDTTIYNKPEFPKGTIEGVGFHEAPRGVLSTGSSSKTAPSRTTRPSSPRRGTPAPATPAAPSAPTKPPSSRTPSPTPNTPSKSCAPSTPSTPAWPARSTPSTLRPQHREGEGLVKTAIYGIGNILLGDDGIGPAVVRYLSSNYTLPPDTTLEDLGTPSLDLPAYLTGYDRVIFIDAVALDAPPGTVHVFSRDEITSVPTGIRVSPHEPTINDALIVLDFAGTAPRDVVLVGVVPETLEGGMTLSPRVAGAVSGAADTVWREVARRADAA